MATHAATNHASCALLMSPPSGQSPASAAYLLPAHTASPGAFSAALSTASVCTSPPPPQQEPKDRNIGGDALTTQLVREQHQMIDQLMGAGLVQAADLLEFGFSIAELRAAGLNLSSPHHYTDQHAKGGMNTMPARRLSDNSSEVRRKRSWESEATQTQHQQDRRATPSLAVCDTATTALSTKASEVQPANRAVESSAFLSEKARAQSLRAARLVENSQSCVTQNCARSLTYEAMDDEEAAAASKKRCNTALNFNGLDVAVVKEIAKQLQEEARNDAYVKSRSMREYIESRKDDNTPYM